jgi:hypothetical protein
VVADPHRRVLLVYRPARCRSLRRPANIYRIDEQVLNDLLDAPRIPVADDAARRRGDLEVV